MLLELMENYKIPVELTLYVLLGIIAFVIVICIIRAIVRGVRCGKLKKLPKESDLFMKQLPKAKGGIEKEYQNLLNCAYSEKLYFEDADERVFRIEENSLDRIVRTTAQRFANEFSENNIGFKYKTVIKKVMVDEKWLSFVIEQILSNSVKNTKDGSVAIYLAENEVLCIEDTGLGIDVDPESLFEKGDSIKSMYLCKLVCEKMGIKISAESIPGEGTKILLRFKDIKKEESN